uniref:dermatan-sulfate epimerase-like protein isoform X1 n=1 Tax=Styela clava TaxID=7725 RepID=UPI00193A8CA4|nr:dermatan-sulfate epimerase-like protein isoform X1 [Styela clava]XP_039249457.1 dermatan-sulfate epimerase-like protein isoform X1 [Styela clava]
MPGIKIMLYFTTILKNILLCKCNLDFSDTRVHPMLYFDAHDVAKLRKIASTSHAKIAGLIQKTGEALVDNPDENLPPKNHTLFASEWNERYGNRLCSYAMYSLLQPEDNVAFELIQEFMDRMESYPDWYLTESRGRHQSPIAHSLIGFTTAYDFLYDRFDPDRRAVYYHKIRNTTFHMREVLSDKKFGWTKQYIHNLAFSNILSIIIGALVVKTQEPDIAKEWTEMSKNNLESALDILSHITDGSLDEGMCYTSYSSRSITQYVYLAQRHFNIDHTNHPWLKQHFWFLYKTTLPGFQHPFGFSDGRRNWCYGPQSQLVFLDAYVMKNGYGNWLADKIRNATSKNTLFDPHPDFLWSTLHTEYIFYNASLTATKPLERYDGKMHIFPDLGLVTFGGGQEMTKRNTFLSFKSGVLNGEYVEYIRYNNKISLKTNRWKGFNPGHEHPDQNSFIFSPNGKHFITEAYYGPKFSFLDNVIIFGPFNISQYNQTWEGQIGETDTWLKYALYTGRKMRGEILTATTSGDMAFIAGESGGAYSLTLGLSSVFRGVLLINPEVLVIIDSIKLQQGSKTKYASALFHNIWKQFGKYSNLGYEGAQVQYPEGSYSMLSIGKGGGNTNVSLHKDVQPGGLGLREGATNYVNVTFSLQDDVTDIIHVFSGPNYAINRARISNVYGKAGVSLLLQINNMEYDIKIATVPPLSVQPHERVTEFCGYATVSVGNQTHYFGLDDKSPKEAERAKRKRYILKKFLNKNESALLPQFSIFTLSSKKLRNSDTQRSDDYEPVNFIWDKLPKHLMLPKSSILILLLPLITLVIFFIISLKIRNYWVKHFWRNMRLDLKILFILSFITVFAIITYSFSIRKNVTREQLSPNESRIRSDTFSRYNSMSTSRIRRKKHEEHRWNIFIPKKPFVFIASLPGSGSNLFNELFHDLSFSNVMDLSKNNYSVSSNLCKWPKNKKKIQSNFIRQLQIHRKENSTNMTFVNDDSGFWISKLPWLRKAVGKRDFQAVVIVRDPRSWISSILDSKKNKSYTRIKSDLLKPFETSCNTVGSENLLYYEYFNQNYKNSTSEVVKLSVLWTIKIANAVANEAQDDEQWPLHIVRFEDVVKEPDETTMDLFSKLGLPLGLKNLSKISRAVKGQRFELPLGDILSTDILDSWKTKLTKSDQNIINNICCPLMNILNYNC